MEVLTTALFAHALLTRYPERYTLFGEDDKIKSLLILFLIKEAKQLADEVGKECRLNPERKRDEHHQTQSAKRTKNRKPTRVVKAPSQA